MLQFIYRIRFIGFNMIISGTWYSNKQKQKQKQNIVAVHIDDLSMLNTLLFDFNMIISGTWYSLSIQIDNNYTNRHFGVMHNLDTYNRPISLA